MGALTDRSDERQITQKVEQQQETRLVRRGRSDSRRGRVWEGRGCAQCDRFVSWSVPWPSCPYCGLPAVYTRCLHSLQQQMLVH